FAQRTMTPTYNTAPPVRFLDVYGLATVDGGCDLGVLFVTSAPTSYAMRFPAAAATSTVSPIASYQFSGGPVAQAVSLSNGGSLLVTAEGGTWLQLLTAAGLVSVVVGQQITALVPLTDQVLANATTSTLQVRLFEDGGRDVTSFPLLARNGAGSVSSGSSGSIGNEALITGPDGGLLFV